jgi:hypothetical protein
MAPSTGQLINWSTDQLINFFTSITFINPINRSTDQLVN